MLKTAGRHREWTHIPEEHFIGMEIRHVYMCIHILLVLLLVFDLIIDTKILLPTFTIIVTDTILTISVSTVHAKYHC